MKVESEEIRHPAMVETADSQKTEIFDRVAKKLLPNIKTRLKNDFAPGESNKLIFARTSQLNDVFPLLLALTRSGQYPH